MAKLLRLLVLQVVLFLQVAISRHVRPHKLDLDELAFTLNNQEVLGQAHFQEKKGILHLDLRKFHERVNDFAQAQLASSEASEIEEDSKYHPWKKADVEKFTTFAMNDENAQSGIPAELLETFMNTDAMVDRAFNLAGKKEEKDECVVGTLFTYFRKHRSKLKKCFHLNAMKIALKLVKYRLTPPVENLREFPKETSNLLEAITAPVLNQPSALVVVNSLIEGFKDYNIKTPFKLTWPFLWLGSAIRNRQLASHYLSPGNVPDLSTYDGYAAFFAEYREKQKDKLFGIFPTKDFIHYPLDELPASTDITLHNRWQSDDVFTQQRLAGLNPMSLRKLIRGDPIYYYFNGRFNWSEAMKNVSGSSMDEMVEDGKVFVLDYPLLHGITNMEDIQANEPEYTCEMRKSVSPIAVFVSVPGKNKYTEQNENTLKPVAIKMDMDQAAPVFTPNDGSKWLMAKEEVQRADIVYVEIIEHLLKTHLLMQPICTIMYRTFRKLHPLYQLFNPHCKYLTLTNSVGVPSLFDQHEFTHIIFSIGNTGAINLLNKGYEEMTWEDTNFEENLKKRGVMDNETLPYFPYRDDGLVLWQKVGKLAQEYVDLYYKLFFKINASITAPWGILREFSAPASIITDLELQSFAMQLNSTKMGMIPGGRFKGFPKMITSHEVLVDVVKRILFIPIQHSAINYPVSYYGAFTPNMPTKLYNPDTQDFSIDCLPQYKIVAYQLSIAMTLGSIRYDKLFDYSDDLVDDEARKIVKKYYDELHGDVNKLIMDRNYKRELERKLTYPYFMPQWLTNSIQT